MDSLFVRRGSLVCIKPDFPRFLGCSHDQQSPSSVSWTKVVTALGKLARRNQCSVIILF